MPTNDRREKVLTDARIGMLIASRQQAEDAEAAMLKIITKLETDGVADAVRFWEILAARAAARVGAARRRARVAG